VFSARRVSPTAEAPRPRRPKAGVSHRQRLNRDKDSKGRNGVPVITTAAFAERQRCPVQHAPAGYTGSRVLSGVTRRAHRNRRLPWRARRSGHAADCDGRRWLHRRKRAYDEGPAWRSPFGFTASNMLQSARTPRRRGTVRDGGFVTRPDLYFQTSSRRRQGAREGDLDSPVHASSGARPNVPQLGLIALANDSSFATSCVVEQHRARGPERAAEPGRKDDILSPTLSHELRTQLTLQSWAGG